MARFLRINIKMKLDLGPNNTIEPQKGMILVSEPFLEDPFFKRTVILLCEHNDEGSFGFVLNNYIEVDIDEIVDGIPHIETKVSIGGPVKNSNLYYIHTIGDSLDGSVQIMDGVWMGGDFDQLKEMIDADEVDSSQVRFFVGYSGWSANQLDDELEQNSWFVTTINTDLIMDTDLENLWQKSLKKFGTKGKIVSNIPENPSLN